MKRKLLYEFMLKNQFYNFQYWKEWLVLCNTLGRNLSGDSTPEHDEVDEEEVVARAVVFMVRKKLMVDCHSIRPI